jgi:hypothetical protein
MVNLSKTKNQKTGKFELINTARKRVEKIVGNASCSTILEALRLAEVGLTREQALASSDQLVGIKATHFQIEFDELVWLVDSAQNDWTQEKKELALKHYIIESKLRTIEFQALAEKLTSLKNELGSLVLIARGGDTKQVEIAIKNLDNSDVWTAVVSLQGLQSTQSRKSFSEIGNAAKKETTKAKEFDAEKATVEGRFDRWVEKRHLYKGITEFASMMVGDPQLPKITKPRTVEGWAREWAKKNSLLCRLQ